MALPCSIDVPLAARLAPRQPLDELLVAVLHCLPDVLEGPELGGALAERHVQLELLLVPRGHASSHVLLVVAKAAADTAGHFGLANAPNRLVLFSDLSLTTTLQPTKLLFSAS